MHQNGTNDLLTADLREHILSALPCGLCVARQDERLSVVFANALFFRMLGYAEGTDAEHSLIGALDCVEPIAQTELLARMALLQETGERSIALEARLRHKDESCSWAIVHISRAENSGGLWICAFMDISAQKRVEEELRVREEEYRIAVRQSEKLVFRYDIAEKTAYFPPDSAELFHCTTMHDLPTLVEQKHVISENSKESFRELCSQLQNGTQPTGSAVLQLSLLCDACEYEWFRVTYSLIYRPDGTPGQAVISLENVTEEHAREVAYQRWQKTYESMPQNNTAYLEFDLTQNRMDAQKGTLLLPMPEQLHGSMESVLRHFIMHYVHADDRERIRTYTAREHLLTEYFRGARPEKLEYRHLREDGRYVWVRLSVQMLPDPYSCNVRASMLLRDVDTQKREELTLKDQLRMDTLTGVLNRSAFLEAANAVLQRPPLSGLHALVMVDVDHFKQINDRFGHGYGDRVLARICDLLRNALRADDLVGRIGGDEFVLLLKNVTSADALQAKIDSLCEQLNQRISDTVCVSCSFGAAVCPQDGADFDALYNKADTALYAAKEAGRNCTRVYLPDMGRPMPLSETAEL